MSAGGDTDADAGTRSLGGFRIRDTRGDALIVALRQRRIEGRPTELLFANTNFIVACQPLVHALDGADTLIVNDGIGVDLAAWFLDGRFFSENVNGTDFTPRLLASLDRPTRVFLLGATPVSIAGAAAAWQPMPNVEIVGTLDGYAGLADDARVMAAIADAAPDLLLVALGDPRQAEWIVGHRGTHRVPLVIAVGALFDFVSGTVPRAPPAIRRLRLEWAYRLVLEPRRLAKRYSIDLVVFFALCVRVRLRERRAARLARRNRSQGRWT